MPIVKPDNIHALIKALEAQERVLLFCLGSGTDWKEAGVTLKTVAGLWAKWAELNKPDHVQPLVTLTWASHRLALTDTGRAALRALLRDL